MDVLQFPKNAHGLLPRGDGMIYIRVYTERKSLLS